MPQGVKIAIIAKEKSKRGDKEMRKKNYLAAALGLMLTGATLLSGCGLDGDAALININKGEDEITLGYGNFVARYTQSLYDATYLNYMGAEMWTKEEDGTTMADDVKKRVLESLQEDYLLEKHAGDYDISLTEEEEKAIQKAATAFMENNDSDTLDAMTATQEIVEQYLTNQTYASKVSEAIRESAEVTVTKEEAAQRTITYAYFGSVTYTDASGNTGYYTDDQKKELKQKAEALVTSADLKTDGEAAGATVSTVSYGADEDTLKEEVVEAADALQEGEISQVVEVGNDGYYVIRLDSAYDEEATEEKMVSLEEEKRTAYLESVLEGWKEETDFAVDEKQWKKVQFDTLFERVTQTDEDTEE